MLTLGRLEKLSPASQLGRFAAHLEPTWTRLAAAVGRMLAHRRRLLESRQQAIGACDPRQVLRRGYSVTRDARTRAVIRSVNQIRDKLRISTEVADGEFRATADDPRQPGLFE